jgi:Beta-lactamase
VRWPAANRPRRPAAGAPLPALDPALQADAISGLPSPAVTVALDRPVRDYLPWFPADWAAITVGELLDHTDGMPATHTELPADDPAWYAAHRFDSYTPEESMATATGLPLAFAPGTAQT